MRRMTAKRGKTRIEGVGRIKERRIRRRVKPAVRETKKKKERRLKREAQKSTLMIVCMKAAPKAANKAINPICLTKMATDVNMVIDTQIYHYVASNMEIYLQIYYHVARKMITDRGPIIILRPPFCL